MRYGLPTLRNHDVIFYDYLSNCLLAILEGTKTDYLEDFILLHVILIGLFGEKMIRKIVFLFKKSKMVHLDHVNLPLS